MGRVLNFKTPIYDDIAIESIWLSEYGVYIAGTDGIKLSVLPSREVNKIKIFGQDGESFIGSRYSDRTLSLQAYINDIDKLDEFKKLLMFDEPRWFHFKNTDTKIKAIVSSEILVKPYGKQGTFDLTLTCTDPYFYESRPTSIILDNHTSMSLYNRGNTISFPDYEITAKGIINIGVNGVVMTLSFEDNYETLIVSTKYKEVRKASQNRLYSNTNFTFPILKAGENKISVTGDCTQIKVTPNSRWA